ncbi:hypothetical protein [Ohtaekwangia sp.]|uniref:hypothetical protein n=1 Tax=Ohtaekwangia sp. TaxID=2066019 RepID=UPI002F93BC7D
MGDTQKIIKLLPFSHYSNFVFSRERLTYWGLWLIIPFSSFTSHTILAIPPTLVLFFVGTIILVGFIHRFNISNSQLLPVACIIYFFISQTIIGAPLARYMGVLFAIAYYVVVTGFGPQLSSERLTLLATKFINYSTLVLIAEGIWRLTHPNMEYASFAENGDARWIYQYKFGGLMYVDSNAVAIHIIILLFFIYYRELDHDERWFKTKMVLIILLILTFSRAGWAGAFLGWVYIRFLRNQKIEFYLVNLVFSSIALIFFYKFYLEEKIMSDLSFQSKLEIIGIVSKYFSTASVQELFFGIGFSNSSVRLGIYAHNFFMVYLIESGLIGLMLIIFMFIQLAAATNKKALYIIVPFLITTLSSTITFMPFFYVSVALIFLMERHKFKAETLEIIEA